jgi:Protein of unknown function (DUF3313)
MPAQTQQASDRRNSMFKIIPRSIILVAVGTISLSATAQSSGGYVYDQTFLTSYSNLQMRQSGGITDFFYAEPDLLQTGLKKFTGVAVDQPEIHISSASKYKGAKPENIVQLAEQVRADISASLSAAGYNVQDSAGPGIILVRLAITDLAMEKKKRGILAYTPIGAVVKLGADALKDFMDKVDITNMTLQAELVDGGTGEELVALVVPRNPAEVGKRIEFDQLDALVKEYGARLGCQLNNAKLSAGQAPVNCLDPAARSVNQKVATPE